MSENPVYSIYREADAPQPGERVECRIIGTIRSPYKGMEDCPSRHNKRELLSCTVQLAPEYAPGLVGLKVGGHALVLYWLHLARRDMVQLPVRAGVRDAPVGVFSLRTPPRPNPIAASIVEIVALRETELDVVGLDCLDGTPLLDIKRARFYEGSEAKGRLG
jgi:tRNA-Thr(GGU) m(6)t(6)A37 methyltransferase TsaA